MSLPINIEKLLRAETVESNRIEYIKEFNPESIIKTLCAFANDYDNVDGGYIIIGVEENNGKPVFPVEGIDIEEDAFGKLLLNYCHHIYPFYYPKVEFVQIDNKKICILWAQAGDARPYQASNNCLKKDSVVNYYVRFNNNTIIAKDDILRRLFENSSRIPYDDRENPFASVDDLSKDLMREHLKSVNSSLYDFSSNMETIDIAKNLGILSNHFDNSRPKNVGILMFSYKVNKFFPYAYIDVVDIPDPTGNNMKEKTFVGPIQKQLQDALEYIKNYMLEENIIKVEGEIKTNRFWNYPFNAIKETLANAVYHRDYQIPEPITVTKTNNYIEIKSFPGFDNSITNDMISNLTIRSNAQYRNRRIGNFLKELELTEGRNTGIPKIVQSLVDNDSDKPLFITDPLRESLIVRIPIHKSFSNNKVTQLFNVNKNRNNEEMKKDILILLMKEDLSKNSLAYKLGYQAISKALTNAVNMLVSDGLITPVGAGRTLKYHYIDNK